LEELLTAIPLTSECEQQLQRTWLEKEGFDHQNSSSAELNTWLVQKNLNETDLRHLATADERLERFRRYRWDSEVEVQFLRRKASLDQVVYSLMRVKEQSLAEELHQCLRDGEADFGALASRHTEGPERQSRGLIGPLPLDAAHPEISNRLRVGTAGQLWPPFSVAGFWVLIQLEKKLPARLDAETIAQMRRELFDAWLRERVQMLLGGEELPPLPPLPEATEELPQR
jgi:parvulin-like peptidyl-prolyl isomerase